MRLPETTLNEDFYWWWKLPKYKKRVIPAKKFGDQTITKRHGSNRDWPGEEKDVDYWVELENGFAVGMRHGRSKTGKRRAKYAEFPVVKIPEGGTDRRFRY